MTDVNLETRATILVVDDTPDNLALISSLLKESYKVKVANGGQKALKIAQSDKPPDLILLDIMMPEMDGYDVCRCLKADSNTKDIPIIFLTAKTEVEAETKGFELGAVDFIVKPISPPTLISRVKTHLDLKKMQDLLREKNVLMQKTLLEVEEMHKQTKSSIEYASIIQHSILPIDDKFQSVFPDSFTCWQPKDIVGGDIWFFETTRREGEYLLFVIDCTGHGVPGAFVTMLVKSIQRSIMMECRITKKEIHPSELLTIFNKEIKNLLGQHIKESESNAGFDGGIVYFDLKRRGIIRYAGAETPLFLIDKEGKSKIIKGSRHSVGYRSCDVNYVYEEHEFSVDSLDRIYLTTDGLIDQNGGVKDIPFGKKKLTSILESNHDKSITEIKELVMNNLSEWKGNSEQNDDITFVGIDFSERTTSIFKSNNLSNEYYMNERIKNIESNQLASDIDKVKEFVKKDGIVFLTYGGFLSQNLIAGFTNAIEKETLESHVGMGDSSNILTIFIELAQNILNYSKTTEIGSEETKAEGMIIVGKSEIENAQQQYYILSQNVVALSDKEKILPKLQDIESLDKDGIKKRYRELRKSGKDAHEKGGGIGFYEIAKRSDAIEYEFTKINEDKFYFQFKAYVNIKPITVTE